MVSTLEEILHWITNVSDTALSSTDAAFYGTPSSGNSIERRRKRPRTLTALLLRETHLYGAQ